MKSEPDRPVLFKLITDHRKHLFENWPSGWPRKENHAIQHDVTVKQYRLFAELIKNRANERELEHFLPETAKCFLWLSGCFILDTICLGYFRKNR